MPLLRVPIRCYGFSLGKVKESCLRAWEVGLPVKRKRTQLGTAPLPSVKDHWVPPFFPTSLFSSPSTLPFPHSPLSRRFGCSATGQWSSEQPGGGGGRGRGHCDRKRRAQVGHFRGKISSPLDLKRTKPAKQAISFVSDEEDQP